jgi:uncharacterized membrane protein YagU involved in acid resistance
MFSRALKPILLGGIVAASIDILVACLLNHRSVPFILHSIAGGLLAQRAYAGGAATALLGLLLQEAMGIIIAAIYVLAARRWDDLRQGWVTWGVIYGVVIFAVMNYIVLPLSAWRVVPRFSLMSFAGNLAAMFLFGLIVAFFASRFGQRATAARKPTP